MLELKERDGLGRICVFKTPHGNVETPALMPVINPRRNIIKPEEMKKMGAQIIITNAYIIKKSFGDKAVEKKLHNLIGFDGPIMTDSGTFQSHVYGEVETTNYEIITYQEEIGSDIGTILDEFVEPSDSFNLARKKVEETLRRAREAREITHEMMLSTPVQGGIYPQLRKWCAEEISKIGDFFPVGGIVPLMENYRFSDLVDIGMTVRMHLPPSAPLHLFGAGHPIVFGLAVMMGADFFDSAAYAKYAMDGRYLTPGGTLHLEMLEDLPCECPICAKTTGKELMELEEEERIQKVALHNLYVSFGEIRRIKSAIRNGELWEYVEEKAHAHPKLFDALIHLLKYRKYLEKYEPLARKVFFYKGRYSLYRPDVNRFRNRIFERFLRCTTRKILVIFPWSFSPYFERWQQYAKKMLEHVDADFVIETPFGPLPLELSLLYPPAVSVMPEYLGRDLNALMNAYMRKLAHVQKYDFTVYWEGESTLKAIEMCCPRAPASEDIELRLIKSVCDFQFGEGAGKILTSGNIEIVHSKNTGRIRNIFRDGRHILSMRNDGYFNLKIEGAKLLLKHLSPPKLRCIVTQDAFEFNAKGKNVFAKFVIDMDAHLVPLDEVIVVNQNDEIAAVGRVLLTSDEVKSFQRGVAVKVREGVGCESRRED
ncbi:MAG: tRNA guanosine(15) transglycosylase TgtA [Thermoplasmata archaeon]